MSAFDPKWTSARSRFPSQLTARLAMRRSPRKAAATFSLSVLSSASRSAAARSCPILHLLPASHARAELHRAAAVARLQVCLVLADSAALADRGGTTPV